MSLTSKLIIAITLACAAPAAAQTLITEPSAERETTKLSGTGGNESAVTFAGQRGVMNAILWSERADDPCWLKIHGFTRIDGAYERVTREHAGCGERDASRKSVGVASPGGDEARLIRGIQVCTNKSGRRLKGIRLWSVRANTRTGALSDDGAPPVTQARNNCETWHTRRFCPAGHVATGVVLQTDGHTVKGASLQCSKIRVSTPMKRP